MTVTYTKDEINSIMLRAFYMLIEEGEEFGAERALDFYHYSAGASAMLYHINNLLEAENASV